MENQNKEEQIIHGRTDKFTAQILSFSQPVTGGAFEFEKAPPDITELDGHQKAISIFYRTTIIFFVVPSFILTMFSPCCICCCLLPSAE